MIPLDPAVQDALDRGEISIAPLAEFDFIDGQQNIWAGPIGHTLNFDGKTYIALGDIGQIDKITEAQGLTDSRTTVSLIVNSESVERIETNDNRGRRATLRLVMIDQRDQTNIGIRDFKKTMGGIDIDVGISGDEGSKIVQERINLELLDETSTLGRSFVTRMTDEFQQQVNSTDRFLEFASDPTVGDTGEVSDRRNSGGSGGGSGGGSLDDERGDVPVIRA